MSISSYVRYRNCDRIIKVRSINVLFDWLFPKSHFSKTFDKDSYFFLYLFRFSVPGSSVGLFCSTPGIPLARAVPRKMSAYMLLTGLPITASEALQSGLVGSKHK